MAKRERTPKEVAADKARVVTRALTHKQAAALAKAAAEEHRSVSDQLAVIVLEWLDERSKR